MTALEDRVNPVGSVSVASLGDITENGSAGAFRFVGTGFDTPTEVYFSFSISSTASQLGDFTAGGLWITVSNGNNDLSITPNNDSNVEGTESIIIVISSSFSYNGGGGTATMNIFDDDTVQVSVAQQGGDPTEGGNGTFRITRSGSTSGNLGVNFTVGGSATSGTDYTSIGTSATITSGNSYVDVSVPTLADNVVDASETVTMTITDNGSTYTALPSAIADVTIVDDPPVITIGSVNVREGESGDVVLTRTGGKLSASLTVTYSVGGTADSGDDYTALSGTVTFSASSDTATITIAALANDVSEESNKTVVLTFTPTSAYTLAGEAISATSSNTIVDNTGSFTLDGQTGSITYNIPWSSVDPYEASQSLPLTNFILTFAGETFTSTRTDITFDTAPVAVFEYGDMTGIAFDIDASGVSGYPYSALSAADWTLAAVNATTLAITTAPVPNGEVTLDFDTATTGQSYKIKLRFFKGNWNEMVTAEVSVAQTDTVSDIAYKASIAINATGMFVPSRNSSVVTIKPTPATGNKWTGLSYFAYSMVGGFEVWNPVLNTATLEENRVILVIGTQNP